MPSPPEDDAFMRQKCRKRTLTVRCWVRAENIPISMKMAMWMGVIWTHCAKTEMAGKTLTEKAAGCSALINLEAAPDLPAADAKFP